MIVFILAGMESWKTLWSWQPNLSHHFSWKVKCIVMTIMLLLRLEGKREDGTVTVMAVCTFLQQNEEDVTRDNFVILCCIATQEQFQKKTL